MTLTGLDNWSTAKAIVEAFDAIADVSPLTRRCECGAVPGEDCNRYGGGKLSYFHAGRVRAAVLRVNGKSARK